jgi:hypothetical protein
MTLYYLEEALAFAKRSPTASTPIVSLNLGSIIKLSAVADLFVSVHDMHDTLSTRFVQAAIDSFLSRIDPIENFDRAVVFLNLMNLINDRKKDLLETPFFRKAIATAVGTISTRPALIHEQTEYSFKLHERNLFRVAAISLLVSGQGLEARKFLRTSRKRLLAERGDLFPGLANVVIGSAALATSDHELADECSNAAIDIIVENFKGRLEGEDNLITIALAAASILGETSNVRRHFILNFIEQRMLSVLGVWERDKWNEYLPPMVRALAEIGELPRARTLADTAPSAGLRMKLYGELLTKITSAKGR